jgi:hypothetical protein
MLGRLLILRGESKRAADILAQVVGNSCVHGGTPHMVYAMALARVGRRLEALAQYKQALHDGLRSSDALMARWQTIWLSNVGRYAVIGVLLATVAAWVLFLKPSPQTLTLLVVLVVIVLLQRMWGTRGKGR